MSSTPKYKVQCSNQPNTKLKQNDATMMQQTFKWLFIQIALSVFVLIIVLSFNTFQLKSRQIQVQPLQFHSPSTTSTTSTTSTSSTTRLNEKFLQIFEATFNTTAAAHRLGDALRVKTVSREQGSSFKILHSSFIIRHSSLIIHRL